MSSKMKEYKVDDHAEKARSFFVACEPNSATKVKVTEAMWVKVYSDLEAANSMLQMLVHQAIKKLKGKSLLPQGSSRLLTTGPGDCINCGKARAKNDYTKSGGCSHLAVGGVNAGIPLQKCLTCHQIINPGARLAWCHTPAPGSTSQI